MAIDLPLPPIHFFATNLILVYTGFQHFIGNIRNRLLNSLSVYELLLKYIEIIFFIIIYMLYYYYKRDRSREVLKTEGEAVCMC